MADERIGARVRVWRRRRGLSQATLAGLTGLSQGYVSQIEAGIRGVERSSTLVAIAAALDVSVADLLGLSADPTDPVRVKAANRRQSYFLDLGRSLAYSGKRDKEALVALARAERAAPAPFRLSPITRDVVSTMIARAQRRAVAEDLSAMALRLGISPT